MLSTVGVGPDDSNSAPHGHQAQTPESAFVRRDAGNGPIRPHLLWIDDEICHSHAEVRYLELQGFRVDNAVTGSEGLAMARARRYDAILLDLNLPDLPGLAVLAALRGEDITTPVLVLTGFGNFESARVAGRFGAVEFMAKPVLIDELETIVKRLVQTPSPSNPRGLRSRAVGDELKAGLDALAGLLEVLYVVSRELHAGPRMEHGSTAKRVLIAALIRSLGNPTLPMPAFMACASALRGTLTSDEHQPASELASRIESRIIEALSRGNSHDSRVARALDMVRSAARQHERLTLEEIARSERIDAAHLGRLIKAETGFEFTDWRTAFLLRPSLNLLIEVCEHVKQIACHHLRYKYESQFDRDFNRFFGLTPSAFRQVCRGRD